jgi:hypothetical protein
MVVAANNETAIDPDRGEGGERQTRYTLRSAGSLSHT